MRDVAADGAQQAEDDQGSEHRGKGQRHDGPDDHPAPLEPPSNRQTSVPAHLKGTGRQSDVGRKLGGVRHQNGGPHPDLVIGLNSRRESSGATSARPTHVAHVDVDVRKAVLLDPEQIRTVEHRDVRLLGREDPPLIGDVVVQSALRSDVVVIVGLGLDCGYQLIHAFVAERLVASTELLPASIAPVVDEWRTAGDLEYLVLTLRVDLIQPCGEVQAPQLDRDTDLSHFCLEDLGHHGVPRDIGEWEVQHQLARSENRPLQGAQLP